jgi:cell division protein FtsL
MPASAAARVEAPVRREARTRPRARARKERRVSTGVLWIAVVGALLAGVVAINVAVLRLKVADDNLGRQRVSLLEKKAQLASQLSSAASTSRIQDAAHHKLGLVPASPDQTVYLHLTR